MKTTTILYYLFLTAFILVSAMSYGQTKPDTMKTTIKPMTATGTNSIVGWENNSTGGSPLLIRPKLYADWTFNTESVGVVARLSVKDSNGQQTGWFDKRYVKKTSDSTFVILPKSK